jgi:hypothetical protein
MVMNQALSGVAVICSVPKAALEMAGVAG